MLANYGYKNGSGEFFITIDTDKCDGCGKCVEACPAGLFQVVEEDPNDPLSEKPVVIVVGEKRKKIKYECGPCKPPERKQPLPCVKSCPVNAIIHSW